MEQAFDLAAWLNINTLLAVALGIGLSAAVGFRIFVPFTVMSVAALSGQLQLTPGFAWVGTWPALILFATATVLEIAAYYIPWLDNALDTIAGPTAVIAGGVAAASVVGDASPMLQWVLAILAGGGIAGAIQAGTTVLRGASTITTGGAANPLVNTAEVVSSLTLSVLAVLLPLAALAIVLALILWLPQRLLRRRRRATSGSS